MESLVQLAIIWWGVFVAVVLAKQTKLTPVLYYLAVGAVLSNTCILTPGENGFIRGLAEIGIVLIMFALGFEEKTANFLSAIKRAWGIAVFGALGPFLTAYLVARFFWGDEALALMFGLAMGATTVSLTMVSLKSEGLSTSPAATGIMTSAVLDNVASLALVAVLVPIAMGGETLTAEGLAWILAKAAVFFLIVTAAGGWLMPHQTVGLAARIPFLRNIGIKHLLGFEAGEHAVLLILAIAALVGILAHAFGFHPAVGAYMAGLVLKEEYFTFGEPPGRDSYGTVKAIVDNVAFSWIGPVFFVELGTRIIFKLDVVLAVLPQTFVLLFGLMAAQIVCAGLAARYIGRFAAPEALMIGFGMLGRAELAFVVMDIAYVQNPILNEEAFYTLMFTAFWLNVAVPVTIAWWKPYYTGEKKLL